MLTKEEVEAFDGLEESYVEMYREIEKAAPVCHFTKMNYESADDGDRSVEFFECRHCGHTKEFY